MLLTLLQQQGVYAPPATALFPYRIIEADDLAALFVRGSHPVLFSAQTPPATMEASEQNSVHGAGSRAFIIPARKL